MTEGNLTQNLATPASGAMDRFDPRRATEFESLNYSLRKIIKGRGAFPNDDSVYRLIYLGLEQISRKWTPPIKNWKTALQQFAILYEDRLLLEALDVTKA
jgi:hypothetical protein